MLALSLTGIQANAQSLAQVVQSRPEYRTPYKPFRIAGNLYYVGTYDLACYLITTPQGHILINEGVSGAVPIICSNIEELGFRCSDIKILLNSQAHFDHVGGLADMKQITGASVMVNKNDAQVLADGGNSDYLYGGKGPLFRPVKADRLLRNKDVINLGGMQLIALNHPGHTKGATSFLFEVNDGSKTYRVLIANMPTILDEAQLPTMPSYPNIASDFEYTFDAMKNIHFDIWLAAHASQCGLHDKHKPTDAYNPMAFADQEGYDNYLEELHKKFLDKLHGK